MRAILFAVTGWNPTRVGGAGVDTVYFGTHAFTTAPDDTPPDTFFEPRITNPGLISISMYAEGTTGGSSSGGFGVVELANSDAALDYLIDWGFGGRSFTILEGPVDGRLTDFATIMSGTVEQPEFKWTILSFRFRDNTSLLTTPVARDFYLGNNVAPDGLEGDTNLKDKPKPRLFGTRTCEEPVLVNSSRLIYQLSDEAILTVVSVRDRGVPLTRGIEISYSNLVSGSTPFTFTHAAVPVTIITTSSAHGIPSDAPVGGRLSSTLLLPTPLSTSSYYYFKYVSDTTLTIHTTLTDAVAGTNPVSITANGTGVYTLTKNLTNAGCYDYCICGMGSFIRLGSAPTGSIRFSGSAQQKTIGRTVQELVAEKLIYSYGNELVTNGDFTAGTTGWLGGGGGSWTISGGAATCISSGGTTSLRTSSDIIVAGKWYELSYTISAYTGGSCTPILGATGTGSATPRTDVGVYREVLFAETSGKLEFQSGSEAFDGTIDDVSVKEVTAIRDTFYVEQSFIDMDKDYPVSTVWGYYTGSSSRTTKDVLDTFARVGFWWGFDNLGLFWIKKFTAPSSANPIMTLTDKEIISVDRVATRDSSRGVPVWKVTCRYKQCGALVTDLAGSVNTSLPNDVPLLTTEWREAIYQDPYDKTINSIRNKHPLAEAMVVDTVFENRSDAVSEAMYQFVLRAPRRDRLKVLVSSEVGGPIGFPEKGYWDDEGITELPFTTTEPAMVMHNNYVYIIGGAGASPTYTPLTSVARLNLDNPRGAWDTTTVPPLPVGRRYISAVVYNNYIYVFGGDGAVTIRININNFSAGWDNAGVTDAPWSFANRAWLYQNWVYIGRYGYNSMARLDLNNPTGAWDTTVPVCLNYRRWDSCAVVGHYLYRISGGTGTNSSSFSFTDLAERLDLDNLAGGWSPISPSMTTSIGVRDRTTSYGVVVGTDIYLIGGYSAGLYIIQPGQPTVNTDVCVVKYDTVNSVWTVSPISDLPYTRRSGVALLYKGQFYTIGGTDGAGNTQQNTWKLRSNDNPDDRNQLTSVGRTLMVSQNRYGYTGAGRPMKIIGTTVNHQTRKIELDLWG